MSDPNAALKQQAALAAVAEVRSGQRLGLGTGSTANFAIAAIGERVQRGELRDLVCVATSRRTDELARRVGLQLVPLEDVGELDLAIDGADEVDPRGNLIKGGGGALLMEKAVERRARRLIIVVDARKLSPKLGTLFALPVEIAPEAARVERAALEKLGCAAKLRQHEGTPFETDSKNFILDCRFEHGIDDVYALAQALDAHPKIRAHGLFLDMASEVIVAAPEGLTRLRFR